MIKRILMNKIAESPKSVLLVGPRQSGKSTLLRSLTPAKIINLADEGEFLKVISDPDYFISSIQGHQVVFVDEVQRVPQLLNTIQSILDESKKIVFYLSGSSARKLRRGQANLLPGRILMYNLGGLCLRELNYSLDIEKALSVGFLPEPYLENKKELAEKVLETYSQVYLREEIQAEALTRNMQGFVRFLNTMAEMSGDILDFSKISTKSKVSRSSIVRFIEILEDTLIGSRVEVFLAAEAADTIKHPKFYFFDGGVLNGLLGNFLVSPDRVGKLMEHLIYSQLKNSAYALDKKLDIYFFRTRHGTEIDFIIRWQNKVYAIEVKSGEVTKADLAGLKAFKNYFPTVEKCYVVSPKESKRILDDITVCSVTELFKDLEM